MYPFVFKWNLKKGKNVLELLVRTKYGEASLSYEFEFPERRKDY
jgi:hypothetical protein